MIFSSKKNRLTIFIAAVVVLLFLLPLFVSDNIVFRAATILVSALFATSFNLLLGYSGLVSFGHAAYFAIGGYTLALFLQSVPSFFLGITLVILISAISALVLGYISFRASGIYFAILTLALGQLVYQIFYQSKWSGGQNGMAGINAPSLRLGSMEIGIHGMPNYYFVILSFVCVSILFLRLVVKSRFGKILISTKEDAVRASFLGVNVRKYQLTAFVISGTLSGLAGALSAPLNSIITADIASWTNSATPIIISLLGGYSYFFGPVIGAFLYEIFNYLTSSLADSSELYIGLLLLAVILLMPRGILGVIDQLRYKVGRRQKQKMKADRNSIEKTRERKVDTL
ncbi:branched-chain amino acid ABC transporter permease [Alteribacillus sp. JSM 102045]|uniref:branched-chain amino acid ABC transporter permease n=1 Tax=Alteribacillus sp. JSM 102045 TaxID=1562101 RepID=UPI0035C210EB